MPVVPGISEGHGPYINALNNSPDGIELEVRPSF